MALFRHLANGTNDEILEKEDEIFLSDVHAATRLGIDSRSHWILWLTVLFLVIALTWANFATLDEVTRGMGKIIPSSQIQVVQNLEGGIVSEILVKEGELVEKGQPLMRLDDVRFASSYNESRLRYYELLIKSTRLTAEVSGEPFVLSPEVLKDYPSLAENAMRLHESRQMELKANISVFEDQLRQKQQELRALRAKSSQLSRSYALLKQELTMSEPLVAQGALSEVELLRLRRSANDLLGELDGVKLSMPRVQAAIDEVSNKIQETKMRFRSEAMAGLNEAKAELDRVSEGILALKDRVTRTRVLSPVRGTVKQVKVTTVGGVIQPGMDLMEIVPIEDQLLVEAQIRPRDIAFLHPGQEATVKLTAYDFSIYGGLRAQVEHISADTIVNKEDDESYYVIRLRTDKSHLEKGGEKLQIIAGMIAEVDILTGKKTVLDYLLKPVLKAQQRALRER